MPDHYRRLGVAPDATSEEIKHAYRTLARALHPDAQSGTADPGAGFAELNDSYRLLLDPERRAAYDQERVMAATPSPAPEPSLSETLGTWVGQAWRKIKSKRGADLTYEVKVRLEDVLEGVDMVLELEREHSCTVCRGAGVLERERCPHGADDPAHCPQCQDDGPKECRSCGGRGRVTHKVSLPTQVPRGVIDRQKILHRGQGQGGRGGGEDGDLYVEVKIQRHPLFVREGRDLHCKVPVSLVDVLLGAELEVPTLTGSVSINMPPGTRDAKVFRLRGRGLPALNELEPGDLYVEIEIDLPETLTPRHIELLRQLRETRFDGPKLEVFRRRLRKHLASHED
ncbi:MAG: hypothetical protein AUK47_09595 [Deltaproteobacteria bacterium CG2_30_63_29]|nr:MAG: hypothetical protein AUK47_09595 [Deltaproteobacteria bacterium CG2_30_63_29]PJB34407.1 MAG: hypothetical protein CO108_28355 [Deltaproteobacteria bacterium CG_4_9_14_3_um_filter_63_12]